MHDKEAGMTSLRVIEARTFVCVETHTKNRKGQSLGREATQTYRIYNAEKRTDVESRNVKFMETRNVFGEYKKTRGTLAS